MNLAVVCLVAFVTVMLLLSVLAGTIRLLTRFFDVPQEVPSSVDAATLAAIQAAVARNCPGAVVLRVEADP